MPHHGAVGNVRPGLDRYVPVPLLRFALIFLCAAALALGPGALPAATAKPRPWATVNICDTVRQPNALGVRASMPGNGRAERMYVRIHAQYLHPTRGRYVDLGGSLSSPWLFAGSARFRRREVGYTFVFAPPPAGRSYLLRARVEFQWRRRRGRRLRAVRRARAVTEAGHRTRGADPRGFSAATCRLL